MHRAALRPAERLDGHTPGQADSLAAWAWQTADLAELADWSKDFARQHIRHAAKATSGWPKRWISPAEVYEEYLRSARAAPLISRHPGLSSIGLSTARQVSIAGMT